MILLLILTCCTSLVTTEIAYFGRPPNGMNPTLYDAKTDPIIQLDEATFNDTVYCQVNRDDCTAFIVEFYSDWCGHCRAYANTYKALANDLKEWEYVVKVGAINCADPNNEATCRANGVQFFPYIKYFPRRASGPEETSRLKPLTSLASMRDEVTRLIISDKSENWPNFEFLADMNTYSELWNEIPPKVHKLAIVFERDTDSLVGAQILLDLSKFNDELASRRCLKSHALVEALHINEFPTVAIFKRGERTPLMVAELRKLLFKSVSQYLDEEREAKNRPANETTHAPADCNLEPQKCREKYYVSELDMLKATRYALFMEVGRTGDNLSGKNLTALTNFIDLLIDYLPLSSITSTPNITDTLAYSHYAVALLKKLKQFFEDRKHLPEIRLSDYQNEFSRIEAEFFNPFPINENWEHCAGSDPQFRGYTCGLWTLFHALTVQAYKKGFGNEEFQPVLPIYAVRDWIVEFFGCKYCRDHFLKMTTKTFQIESHVSAPEDVYVYLWKAHNIVNARLKGRDTEDPEYPKYQFPPTFLCPKCSKDGIMDDNEVKHFLVDYYSYIKPYRKTSASSYDGSRHA